MTKSNKKQLEIDAIVDQAPNLDQATDDTIVSISEMYERQLHSLAIVRSYLESQLDQCDIQARDITHKLETEFPHLNQ